MTEKLEIPLPDQCRSCGQQVSGIMCDCGEWHHTIERALDAPFRPLTRQIRGEREARRFPQLARLALICMLGLGCVADPTVDATKPPPPNPPAATSVEAAAQQAIVDYANGLADAAQDAADRTDRGEFKGNGEIYQFNIKANTAARKNAEKGYAAALDKATGAGDANAKYDQAVTSKALHDAAKGFRKAGKR